MYTSLNVYDLCTPHLIIISMHVGEIKFYAVPFTTPKASVGMYSGCDTLSLQILFVYFLALSSLLHPSILIVFYTCCPSFLSMILHTVQFSYDMKRGMYITYTLLEKRCYGNTFRSVSSMVYI